MAFGLAASSPARAISYAYVQEGSPLTYSRGTSQPDPLRSDPDFVETADWVGSAAGFGIGYGDGDDNTLLSDMQDSYVTVYVRATFDVGARCSEMCRSTRCWAITSWMCRGRARIGSSTARTAP